MRPRSLVNQEASPSMPMAHLTPPFRADHVGSLLRSKPLQDARAKREKGAISGDQLKEVEDHEIEKIIKPLHPRTFNLITPRDLRKAIAEIVEDLEKL